MPPPSPSRRSVAARLASAGFIAAEEEAAELLARAVGDVGLLEALVARRLTGEPLAWVTGSTVFCGVDVLVHPGVYVPRPQTELLAGRAAERLPDTGTAIDLCTGSGAVAKVLAANRPGARVLAVDADGRAVACARANGLEAFQGDLFAPLPAGLLADVVTAVVPYVPTGELGLLHRDSLAFEPRPAFDGGPDGTALLRRVIAEAVRWLAPGGALLLELGAGQPDLLAEELRPYDRIDVLVDEDGDVRGVEAVLSPRTS